VFATKLSEGDVTGALACWTQDAVIAAADGSSANGRAALRERFEQLAAAGASLRIEVQAELIAGDAALARTEMVMRLRDGESELRVEGNVVYRLVGGRWLIAIDRITPRGTRPGKD
jgi:ketosteroid isomerase-like protein